jgi:hypothetical protein
VKKRDNGFLTSSGAHTEASGPYTSCILIRTALFTTKNATNTGFGEKVREDAVRPGNEARLHWIMDTAECAMSTKEVTIMALPTKVMLAGSGALVVWSLARRFEGKNETELKPIASITWLKHTA